MSFPPEPGSCVLPSPPVLGLSSIVMPTHLLRVWYTCRAEGHKFPSKKKAESNAQRQFFSQSGTGIAEGEISGSIHGILFFLDRSPGFDGLTVTGMLSPFEGFSVMSISSSPIKATRVENTDLGGHRDGTREKTQTPSGPLLRRRKLLEMVRTSFVEV